jgi:hypothetical protein
MRGRRSSLTLTLTPEERTEIGRWQRATTGPAGLARRGRARLLLEQSQTFKEVARLCGMRVRHVRKWAERYRAHGRAGLRDQPRPGRTPVVSPRGRAALGQDGLRAAR